MSRTDSCSSTANRLARQAVIDAAAAVGAVAVSWSCGDVLPDVESLKIWQAHKMHGSMRFMGRSSEKSLTGLLGVPESNGDTQPAAPITVISLIFPYQGAAAALRADSRPGPVLQRGEGRIARYATGPDYHAVIPARLERFVVRLKALSAKPQWRWFTDAVPLLERAWARAGEIGFQGKNTMIIRPQVGSFFFISEVLTTASIEGSGETIAKGAGCGPCSRCGAACPTAALQTPYRLDARRCISYLTIEKRGVLAEWERRALGDWLFGCDICQEVCPFNHDPCAPLSDFAEAKVGETAVLHEVLALRSEADFQRFCGGTPIERTRRAGLVRNAICVAVNREQFDLFEAVLELIVNDPSPTVRATAVWGARELVHGSDSRSRCIQAFARASNDIEEVVRQECARWDQRALVR